MQWEAVYKIFIRWVQKLHHASMRYGKVKIILISGSIWPTLPAGHTVLKPSPPTHKDYNSYSLFNSCTHLKAAAVVWAQCWSSPSTQWRNKGKHQASGSLLQKQALTWGRWMIFSVSFVWIILSWHLTFRQLKFAEKESCARSLWLNLLLSPVHF